MEDYKLILIVTAAIGGSLAGISAILSFFKKKPASMKEEAEANKLNMESEAIKENIRESSIETITGGYEDLLEANKKFINELMDRLDQMQAQMDELESENAALKVRCSDLETKIRTYESSSS